MFSKLTPAAIKYFSLGLQVLFLCLFLNSNMLFWWWFCGCYFIIIYVYFGGWSVGVILLYTVIKIK